MVKLKLPKLINIKNTFQKNSKFKGKPPTIKNSTDKINVIETLLKKVKKDNIDDK